MACRGAVNWWGRERPVGQRPVSQSACGLSFGVQAKSRHGRQGRPSPFSIPILDVSFWRTTAVFRLHSCLRYSPRIDDKRDLTRIVGLLKAGLETFLLCFSLSFAPLACSCCRCCSPSSFEFPKARPFLFSAGKQTQHPALFLGARGVRSLNPNRTDRRTCRS